MRTSNKILLGTFLTAILLISAIHIALYAKYKNGSYSTLKEIEEDNFNHHSIKNVTRIIATGFENITLIPSDTAKLDIEKSTQNNVRFEIKDGTLIIRGDSVFREPGKPDYIQRSYQDINIYLPSFQNITVDNSTLYINGSKDSSNAKSYEIDLQNGSSFDFRDRYNNDSTYSYFKSLRIRADNSEIGFDELCKIALLQVELKHSEFNDNSAKFEKISIKLDSLSNINMQGYNLQKTEMIK